MSKEQNLIFKHSGKLGDIIYSLPFVAACGGGVFCLSDDMGRLGIKETSWPPTAMSKATMDQMIEFLETQPYIKKAEIYTDQKIDYDLDIFRDHVLPLQKQLPEILLRLYKKKFDLRQAWISNITPLKIAKIVINVNCRYHLSEIKLNWKVMEKYRKEAIFIGFEEDYEYFVKSTDLKIDRHIVSSILEFSRIIRGADIFIGNASLGMALANGMKCPRILQVSLYHPCTLPRTSNSYLFLRSKIIDRHLNNTPGNKESLVGTVRMAVRNKLIILLSKVYNFVKNKVKTSKRRRMI